MNLRSLLPPLKIITDNEVSVEKYNEVVRAWSILVQYLYNPGDVVAHSLTIPTCPLSGYGLPTGGVYKDSGGSLWIVQEGEAFAPSFIARAKLGTVTTT